MPRCLNTSASCQDFFSSYNVSSLFSEPHEFWFLYVKTLSNGLMNRPILYVVKVYRIASLVENVYRLWNSFAISQHLVFRNVKVETIVGLCYEEQRPKNATLRHATVNFKKFCSYSSNWYWLLRFGEWTLKLPNYNPLDAISLQYVYWIIVSNALLKSRRTQIWFLFNFRAVLPQYQNSTPLASQPQFFFRNDFLKPAQPVMHCSFKDFTQNI